MSRYMAEPANEKGAGKKLGRVRKRREAEEKKEEPLERREGGGKGKRARRQRPTARKVARNKPTGEDELWKAGPEDGDTRGNERGVFLGA